MLLWAEGFESFAASDGVNINTLIDKKYLSRSNNIVTTTGRIDGLGITLGPLATFRTPILTASNTVIVGVAVRLDTMPSIGIPIFELLSGGSTQIRLYINSGFLIVYGGTGFTELGVAAGIFQDVWHYVEFKCTIHPTTGSFELRIDGQVVASDTNVDTQINGSSTNVDQVYFYSSSLSGMSFDDFYVCNNSGSLNNDFLGDVHVVSTTPDGAGNATNWSVTGAASNYQAVDEIPPDDDTSYVSTNYNVKDTYNYSDISTNYDTIYGVQINTYARKDDAGTTQFLNIARSNSVEDTGTTHALTTNYLYYSDIFETNPDTSAQWTASEINSAEFGVTLINSPHFTVEVGGTITLAGDADESMPEEVQNLSVEMGKTFFDGSINYGQRGPYLSAGTVGNFPDASSAFSCSVWIFPITATGYSFYEITAANIVGDDVTLTTDSNHGWLTGYGFHLNDYEVVDGLNIPNGWYTITDVPAANQLTFTYAGASGTLNAASLWVERGIGGITTPDLVACWDGVGENGWALSCQDDIGAGYSNALDIFFELYKTGTDVLVSELALSLQQWHLITFGYNGSNEIYLQVDQEVRQTAVVTGYNPPRNTDERFFVGYDWDQNVAPDHPNTNADGGGCSFWARFAKMGWWTKYLSSGEHDDLYNLGMGLLDTELSGSLLTNLEHYWNLDSVASFPDAIGALDLQETTGIYSDALVTAAGVGDTTEGTYEDFWGGPYG